MKREHFSSRLGFILITAACSIGLGNIWRFPYVTGKYGGASFVIFYLFFLVILGLPIVVMEFAVGRASQRSTALSFNILEPKGTKWHWFKYITIIGNYLLMMFYTVISGWLLYYFGEMVKGRFQGLTSSEVANVFSGYNFCFIWYLHNRFTKGCGTCNKNYDVIIILPFNCFGRQVCPAPQCRNWITLLSLSRLWNHSENRSA